MDVIYRAFDGKEFEEEDDCLYYEKEITAEKYKNDIIGLDDNLEEINLFDGMNNFFQRSYFILIKTNEAADFIEENSSNCDFRIPHVRKGEYYYDKADYEWRTIDEKVSELYRDIEEITEIKRKLYRLSEDKN